MSIGIHRGVEIAGVLQIESQVDVGFRNVRLRLDAAPIGLDRAGRVAQVFADQSKREPGAAIARSKSHGSFELDAGRLQFARLSQARSKRHSRFGEIGRRLERSSESDDGLRGRLIACRAAPNRAWSIGSAEDSAARAKASTAVFGWPALRSASPISRQPSTKFGKRSSRSSRTDRAFSSPDLDERHASQEGRLRPIGGQTGGALQPDSRLREISRRARHARSDDQRRRMIGAQTQAGVGPARGVVKAPAPERDCRRQLMRRRVVRSSRPGSDRIELPRFRSSRRGVPPKRSQTQTVDLLLALSSNPVISPRHIRAIALQSEHKPSGAPCS